MILLEYTIVFGMGFVVGFVAHLFIEDAREVKDESEE